MCPMESFANSHAGEIVAALVQVLTTYHDKDSIPKEPLPSPCTEEIYEELGAQTNSPCCSYFGI